MFCWESDRALVEKREAVWRQQRFGYYDAIDLVYDSQLLTAEEVKKIDRFLAQKGKRDSRPIVNNGRRNKKPKQKGGE